MYHRQNSLETAGYVYNPFSQNDIWGAPSQLSLREPMNSELKIGADDSALPMQFAGVSQNPQTGMYHRDTHITNNANITQGSNTAGVIFENDGGKKDKEKKYAMEAAVLFIAIVAVAVYYRR
jgi:hypothetical protein